MVTLDTVMDFVIVPNPSQPRVITSSALVVAVVVVVLVVVELWMEVLD